MSHDCSIHYILFFNGNFWTEVEEGVYVRSKSYLSFLQHFFWKSFSAFSVSRCAQDKKFKGRRTHIRLPRRGMPFPLHLVSVHQTSQSTMRHLPKASAAAHTFCILGFFCHPWETAWWSGIMGICLTKSSFPTLSFWRSSGCSGSSSGLGI